MKSKSFNQFMDSFRRINIKYIYVLIYDVLFFFLPVYLILTFWSSQLMSQYKGIAAGIPSMQSAAGIASSAQAITTFMRSSIISTILIIVLIYLLWCLSRSFIWTTILNKKLTFKFYKRFSLLNLIWVPLSFILHFVLAVLSFILVYVLAKLPSDIMIANRVSPIIAMLFLHIIFIFVLFPFIFYILNLASMLYINFTKTNQIKKSFIDMTTFVITNITKLYMPYVYMSAVFAVITWLAQLFKLISNIAYTFTLILLLLLYFAWHKFYVLDITKHL